MVEIPFTFHWRVLMSHGQNSDTRASVNCTGLVPVYFVHIAKCTSVLENANFLIIEYLFPIIFNRLNMAAISGPFVCVFEIRIFLLDQLSWGGLNLALLSCASLPGGGIPGGVSSVTAAAAAAAAAAGGGGLPQKLLTGGDRYAALAELDTVFSSSAPATSVYNTTSTSQGWDTKHTHTPQ